MTDKTTEPLTLLRNAENYLSALHGSVARHDHLAANLGCAGCELRDRIAAALPELAAVSLPPADQTPLRDRIRRVLCERDGQGALWGTDMLEPDEYGADADAVLAVLPATADQTADRAAVLRDEAALIEKHCPDHGPKDQAGVWMDCHCAVADDMQKRADELRGMADETPTTEICPTPETHNWGCGCPSDEHPAALGTLPAWLHQRFDPRGPDWDQLDDGDRSYWEHQARAVRRAVARGGFKQPAAGAHVCKPGASVYYCPTSGETESNCHSGFDVCCDRPDLHQPAVGARQDGAQP